MYILPQGREAPLRCWPATTVQDETQAAELEGTPFGHFAGFSLTGKLQQRLWFESMPAHAVVRQCQLRVHKTKKTAQVWHCHLINQAQRLSYGLHLL